MKYTYAWMDSKKTSLKATDELGAETYIGANSGSNGWKQFIDSGSTATDFDGTEPADEP